jgi:hypothetical protein
VSEKLAGVIGLFVIMTTVVLTVGTWCTMLGLGILHSRIPAIPALGFGDSFFVNIGIGLVLWSHMATSVARRS